MITCVCVLLYPTTLSAEGRIGFFSSCRCDKCLTRCKIPHKGMTAVHCFCARSKPRIVYSRGIDISPAYKHVCQVDGFQTPTALRHTRLGVKHDITSVSIDMTYKR